LDFDLVNRLQFFHRDQLYDEVSKTRGQWIHIRPQQLSPEI
jgi:hypothetical protein